MPSSGDLEAFVSAVATYRGRPIKTMPQPLDVDAPTGFWVASAQSDWIVYPDDVAAEQRAAIICHELAHMLLDHQPTDGGDELAQMAAPSLAPDVARRFLTRHGYADRLEAEAEALATQLVAELARRADEHTIGADNISRRLR